MGSSHASLTKRLDFDMRCIIASSASLPFVQQVRHMFDEIDYVLEGKNAERFAILYSHGES